MTAGREWNVRRLGGAALQSSVLLGPQPTHPISEGTNLDARVDHA